MVASFRQVRFGPYLLHRFNYFILSGWTLAHWCPACNELHDFAVDKPFLNGSRWTFSGTKERPSLTPSMNIRVGPFPAGVKKAGQFEVCHYFLREGQLIYQGDCTHALRGQTIALPTIPDRAGFSTPLEDEGAEGVPSI